MAELQTTPELRTETMTVNMGPQHPSTHGVLRIVLELDGETVVNADTTVGYLHTGIEKTAEQKKWQQVIPLVERMDYLGAQSNSLAFCLAVEKLLGVEMPERVNNIRVLIAELQRIASHLVWLGTHGLEIGAVSVMMYCFRERELLLNINEMLAGLPDVPELPADRRPARGPAERLPRDGQGLPRSLSRQAGRVRGPAHQEPDLVEAHARASACSPSRTRWTTAWSGRSRAPAACTMTSGAPSRISATRPTSSTCRSARRATSTIATWCASPRCVRASKIARQALERITPRGVYDIQDYRIVPPPKDKVYTEMEALIQHFLIYSQGFTVPAGEAYVPIEGPRGEHGFSIVSDGTNRPYRIKLRAPSFYACQGLPKLIVGGMIADVIAVIGSTDVVMGDVDR